MKNQIDLINEMKEHRFFRMGEEDIVIFEKNANLIKEQNNIEVIPVLCSVLEDDVTCCAPCENVIKVIQHMVLKANEAKEEAILKVFEGTKKMLDTAYEWAMLLHTQFICNEELLPIYVQAFQQLNNDEDRKMIINLLNDIYDEEFFEEPDLQDIIRRLEKNEN